MEDFITYKVPRKKGPPLMLPPPYCRKAEKKKNEEMADAIPPLKLEVSDPSKILVLCESLTDSSTRDLEAKVNKYVSFSPKNTSLKLCSIYKCVKRKSLICNLLDICFN